jgi:hypothetical protein
MSGVTTWPLLVDVEEAANALAESEPEVIIHLVPAGQMIELPSLLLRCQTSLILGVAGRV